MNLKMLYSDGTWQDELAGLKSKKACAPVREKKTYITLCRPKLEVPLAWISPAENDFRPKLVMTGIVFDENKFPSNPF